MGESFLVSATVFREGHDLLGSNVVLRGPGGAKGPWAPMRLLAPGTDRWGAEVAADAEGDWTFHIEAWGDPLGSWLHDAEIKVPAGLDVELMLEEGALLFERAAGGVKGVERDLLTGVIKALRDETRPPTVRLAAATAADVTQVLARSPSRPRHPVGQVPVARRAGARPVWVLVRVLPKVSRGGAGPDGSWQSGTFATAAVRLPEIAAMGFDVVYLPPVHPIGHSYRKGPNNTLDPGPDDPGVPWAIGAESGGHDAIHPDLGTLEDFDAFVAEAGRHGLEIALDFAINASPDHPWVSEHPEWFTTRADGSIAYAENPPKKYQDIFPLNFDNDYKGLFAECRRIVRFWMGHGVRIFRVDNPHTKPVAFWEGLLADIRATDPDVLFLAEAFTRPAMMRHLATVGFHQSYTYFTWRNEKWELEAYFTELSQQTAHVLRPNCFVNTQDILHAYLQYGGPPAFKIRAVLAATLSPTWGVYSGFELYEHVALRPGSEEYLDSEKYAYRPRDYAAAEAEGSSLAPYLTRLNEIRRAHPALHRLRNLTFHATDSDQVMCFSKREGDDTIIVVVNLDPHGARETTVHLDLPSLGLAWDDRVVVRDELTGESFPWGPAQLRAAGPVRGAGARADRPEPPVTAMLT